MAAAGIPAESQVEAQPGPLALLDLGGSQEGDAGTGPVLVLQGTTWSLAEDHLEAHPLVGPQSVAFHLGVHLPK